MDLPGLRNIGCAAAVVLASAALAAYAIPELSFANPATATIHRFELAQSGSTSDLSGPVALLGAGLLSLSMLTAARRKVHRGR